MSANFQSIADWQPPETLPKDTPGEYLVLLSRAHRPATEPELAVYAVKPISNGVMRLIGGHFAWDILSDRTKIVAWAPRPAPPLWLE